MWQCTHISLMDDHYLVGPFTTVTNPIQLSRMIRFPLVTLRVPLHDR